LYPNPAADACTVELPPSDASTPADALATVTLRDALGRRVWQTRATGRQQQVPLIGRAPGLYVLTIITTAGRIYAQRLSVINP
ncbi:MAG: T9SS type A sorting domain-containing protein, partial [Hymenobacteraceae bacterium]|nr:T9SS type A sorting domain-containing protein [Hymenobacteraceae bacterium]